MAPRFDAQLKSQQEWGWLLSTWLFLSGTACGLYLIAAIAGLGPAFARIALGLLLLGGVVLLIEQGSPLQAWRAVSGVGTSWLSRGVLFVIGFVVTGSLSVAPASWLPWEHGGIAARIIGWMAAGCALMIILYPGFFLANHRSIPFWNTPLVPALLAGYAALSASGVVLLARPLLNVTAQSAEPLAAVLIAINAVLLLTYLIAMHRAGSAARESVRLLSRAALGWIFWAGVVAAGLILPSLLLLGTPSQPIAAGVGILIGSLLLRYGLLKAGVYVPAPIVQEGLDFSRLNRTSDELMREYAGAGRRLPTGG